eukprot:TRINITY_DN16081_c0_g1_i1.p1 TRINITY_DN16081_c0_g1~~TRINITY_DN16081_c0_g1_i1.p1  ORF type:complete len:1531 (+),score=644.54 TRINITY_DN16081_c0_g1_i1:74-4666(+)
MSGAPAPPSGPAAPACAAQLLLMKRGSSQHVYPKVVDLAAAFDAAGKDALVIGRGTAADIVLPVGELPSDGPPALHSISRKHCILTRRREGGVAGEALQYSYTISDNKSLNGTFINWGKIDTTAVPFRSQDMLCFGGGARLQLGEKLSEQPVADQHPVAYRMYVGAAPGPQDAGVVGRVKVDSARPEDVAEYSQVSCRSLDGQLELVRIEDEQRKLQQLHEALPPPPPVPSADGTPVDTPDASQPIVCSTVASIPQTPLPPAATPPPAAATPAVPESIAATPQEPVEAKPVSPPAPPKTPPRVSDSQAESKRKVVVEKARPSAAAGLSFAAKKRPAPSQGSAPPKRMKAEPLTAAWAAAERASAAAGGATSPSPKKKKRRLQKPVVDEEGIAMNSNQLVLDDEPLEPPPADVPMKEAAADPVEALRQMLAPPASGAGQKQPEPEPEIPPADRFDFDLLPVTQSQGQGNEPPPPPLPPVQAATPKAAAPVVAEPPTVLSQTRARGAVPKPVLKKEALKKPDSQMTASNGAAKRPAAAAKEDTPQKRRKTGGAVKRSPLPRAKRPRVPAGVMRQGLPKIPTAFDLLCADRRAAAAGKGKDVTRPQLIKAWRDLDVARKEAYERRAAAEKEALIKKHPELALLNPHQEDEEQRLLVANGAKVRPSRDKAAKMQGRAMMRAARAKLFEDVEESTAAVTDKLNAVEQTVQTPGAPPDSYVGDLFQLDDSMLDSYVQKGKPEGEAVAALSERVLGRRGDHTLILPKNLADLLKRHQVKGVQFLWRNLVALPEMLAKAEEGQAVDAAAASGCIVAHGMGLGKTLTSTAFFLMWLRMGKANRILVVAPKSTLKQWVRELADWSEAAAHETPPTYLIESMKHAAMVKEWDEHGGVLLASFAMFVRLIGAANAAAASPRGSASPTATAPPRQPRASRGKQAATAEDKEDEKAAREIMRASQFVDDDDEAEQAEVERAAKETQKQAAKAQDPEVVSLLQDVAEVLKTRTSLVVVDEGHKISSPSAALTQSLNALETLNRVVLTGTPLQNNMKQYHTMIDFVRPGAWGVDDLNDIYVRAAADPSARVELAHAMKGFIQRVDCRVLRDELPPLTEYVVFTTLSPLQRRVYSELMSSQGGDQNAKVKTSKALSLSALMMKLCSHTHLLRSYCYSKGVKPLDELEKTDEGDEFDVDNDAIDRMKKGLALYNDTGRDFSWALPLFQNDSYLNGDDDALAHNPKTEILLDIVAKATDDGEKLVVFCESAGMMDVVESCLKKRAAPAGARRLTSVMNASTGLPTRSRRSTGTVRPQWRKGTDYHRLDGSVGLNKRQALCDDFNNPQSKSHVLLISTRAGGLGINLTGATRVVLYGVSWNPQSELQAIYRSYRYGQRKPVTVYRLVAQGSVEQTVFARNAAKMQMAMQVLEDRWTRTDLKSFDVIPPTDWSYHAGKDTVLQVLHQKHSAKIHSVLPHDSLKLPLDAVEEQEGSDASSDDDSVVQILLEEDSSGSAAQPGAAPPANATQESDDDDESEVAFVFSDDDSAA